MYLYNKKIEKTLRKRKIGRIHIEGSNGISLCKAENNSISFDTHAPSRPKGRKLCVACERHRRKGTQKIDPRPRKRRIKSPVKVGKITPAAARKAVRKSFYRTKRWAELRYEALKKNDGRCELCGRSKHDGAVLHVDHIRPIKTHPELREDPDNFQVLCMTCNWGKGNRHEDDWRDPDLAKLTGEKI